MIERADWLAGKRPTLLDIVKKFDGKRFIHSTHLATALAGVLPSASDVGWEKLAEFLKALREECEALELRVTIAQIDRTLCQIKVGNRQDPDHQKLIYSMVSNTFLCVRDEMGGYSFLSLTPTEGKFFADSQFSQRARERFHEGRIRYGGSREMLRSRQGHGLRLSPDESDRTCAPANRATAGRAPRAPELGADSKKN